MNDVNASLAFTLLETVMIVYIMFHVFMVDELQELPQNVKNIRIGLFSLKIFIYLASFRSVNLGFRQWKYKIEKIAFKRCEIHRKIIARTKWLNLHALK